MNMTQQTSLEELLITARLADLERANVRLCEEVETLRGAEAAQPGEAATRRAVLKGAVAATAGLVSAGLLGPKQVQAATNDTGDSVVAGQTTGAEDTTTLVGQTDLDPPLDFNGNQILRVVPGSGGRAPNHDVDAVYGLGVLQGNGVVGEGSSGNGVVGRSSIGAGVVGTSVSSVGGAFEGPDRAPLNLKPEMVSMPPAAGVQGDFYVTVNVDNFGTLWFHTGIAGWRQVVLT